MGIEETLSLWIANDSGLYFALEDYADDADEFHAQFVDYLEGRESQRSGLVWDILSDFLNQADWHEIVKDVYSS